MSDFPMHFLRPRIKKSSKIQTEPVRNPVKPIEPPIVYILKAIFSGKYGEDYPKVIGTYFTYSEACNKWKTWKKEYDWDGNGEIHKVRMGKKADERCGHSIEASRYHEFPENDPMK